MGRHHRREDRGKLICIECLSILLFMQHNTHRLYLVASDSEQESVIVRMSCLTDVMYWV